MNKYLRSSKLPLALRLLLATLLFSTGAVMAVIAVTSNTAVAPSGPGIISTIAGGPGRGRATNLSMGGDVALRDGILYLGNGVLRAVDLATGVATVVAGHDAAPLVADGSAALSGGIAAGQIAHDPAGDVYFNDGFLIRKIDQSGLVTTVAGSDQPCNSRGNTLDCFRGDGGPATQALFQVPQGIAFDARGNLYVADSYNNRIRKVDLVQGSPTYGVITTVAGTGIDYNDAIGSCDGDGLLSPAGDGGPAVAALLCVPTDIAFDAAGNMYIADSRNHRVRKVDAATQTIRTVAGFGFTGETGGGYRGDGGQAILAYLLYPEGLELDSAGNLYIADTCNNRVRKVDTAGVITTVAGSGAFGCIPAGFGGDGGPATSARLAFPKDVALDSAGNLYINDSYNVRIRKVDSASQVITTVAGNGFAGFGGDGGPAIDAQLNNPRGLAADAAGNIYLADRRNSRIRKLDPSGTITTVVAANQLAPGTLGYGGDGGPAGSAQLNFPGGVALDAASNLYIIDTHNNRIRKVDSSGVITTVAGSGESVDCGFYTCVPSAGSGDGGPATTARLALREYGTNPPGNSSGVGSIAIAPSGDLYIADTYNHRIRKVDAATNTITTVAGTGTKGYSGDGGPAMSAEIDQPLGVALDAAGNLYIADRNNQRIRKVDLTRDSPSYGVITTVAGSAADSAYSGDGGPATSAKLNNPGFMAFDAAGNLHFLDTGNRRVRKVDAAGVITTVAGTGFYRGAVTEKGFAGDGGAATDAQLDPGGLTFDTAGNLYVSDFRNNRIRKVEPSPPAPPNPSPCTSPLLLGGTITTIAGNGTPGSTGDGGPAVQAQFNLPRDVAVDTAGNLYIADLNNHRIRKVDTSGTVTTVAGSSYGYSGDGGPAILARLYAPEGVTVDRAGNLYIADTFNHRIRKVDTSGFISTVAGRGYNGARGDGGSAMAAELGYPKGVAVDSAGNLYIAQGQPHNRVRKVEAATQIITTVAGGGTQSAEGVLATSALLLRATKVTVDAAGNLYIADRDNSVIRKVDAATKTITTVAGNRGQDFTGDGGPATSAQLYFPEGMAVDANGNVHIADSFSQRVRRVDAALSCNGKPVIQTVAGSGPTGQKAGGYGGDGGPATDAKLNSPTNVAIDSNGNIYVAELQNHRIRKISFDALPVQLLGVISRKLHGGAGTFDINLPLTGTPGIECRKGGANGDHKLVFTFANPVTVNGTPDKARVTSGTGTVSSVTVNGAEVTVDLTGVTNAQKITLTLFNVSDGTNTGDVSVPMGVLLGDTTADGSVNSADISQTKSQSGQVVTASNFREDLTVDGSINSADISLVKSKSGTALP